MTETSINRLQLSQLVSYLTAHDFVERDPAGYLKQMLEDARQQIKDDELSYSQGFGDGVREAANTLRNAARDHLDQSKTSKKVLESQAHLLAASLLASWANGLDINADRSSP